MPRTQLMNHLEEAKRSPTFAFDQWWVQLYTNIAVIAAQEQTEQTYFFPRYPRLNG